MSCALMDPFLCFLFSNLMFLVDPITACFLMDPSLLETSCVLIGPKTSCVLMDPLPPVI